MFIKLFVDSDVLASLINHRGAMYRNAMLFLQLRLEAAAAVTVVITRLLSVRLPPCWHFHIEKYVL